MFWITDTSKKNSFSLYSVEGKAITVRCQVWDYGTKTNSNSLVELGNVVTCPKPMIFFNVSLHIESQKESEQALSPSMKIFSLSCNCDPGMYEHKLNRYTIVHMVPTQMATNSKAQFCCSFTFTSSIFNIIMGWKKAITSVNRLKSS